MVEYTKFDLKSDLPIGTISSTTHPLTPGTEERRMSSITTNVSSQSLEKLVYE